MTSLSLSLVKRIVSGVLWGGPRGLKMLGK